jgi:hypothetical protein
MTKPRISVAIVLIATMFSQYVGYAQQLHCTDVEGRRAETEAGGLRTWNSLYRSFRLYRQCDDGAIGEGYSESVARILVDHWNTLPQLDRLATKDDEFRRFVMRHVDATLNAGDLEKISKNAKMRCRTGLLAICNDLTKEADSALKEDVTSP